MHYETLKVILYEPGKGINWSKMYTSISEEKVSSLLKEINPKHFPKLLVSAITPIFGEIKQDIEKGKQQAAASQEKG